MMLSLLLALAPQSFPIDLERRGSPGAQPSHVYQCWLAEGLTVARSPALGFSDLPRLETMPGELTYEDIALPDGGGARAVAVRFLVAAQTDQAGELLDAEGSPRARGAESHPVEVVVARSTKDLERSLRLLRWILFATWAISMLTCAGILSWLVRRGLSPLRRLSNQIHSVDQDRLDGEFELPGAAEELEPVVKQLNGFMGRIRDAFEREHAFTAHAAHELRTPLAGLRSTLEVSLSKPRDAGDYVEAEESCLAMTMQLQRLVERLLELARATAPNAERRQDEVDLNALIDEAWLPLSDTAAERGVSLELDVPRDLVVTTDRQLLRRILQNILENASVYADESTQIEFSAERTAVGFQIACANLAAGVSAETAKSALDPFWRSDLARDATGIHAGLGLALCQSFVEVLGGGIDVSAKDGRFIVRIHV